MGATGRQLHYDVPLSNLALNYRPMGMVADMVMPIVRVGKQSDGYNIWSQADILRVEDTRRAPGTEANRVTLNVSSAAYYCNNYALKRHIVVEDMANADAWANQMLISREGAVRFLSDKLMLDWERRIANLVTSTSNVGSSSTVTSAWTDYTAGNSDPAGNIWTAMDNVQDATGYRPNRILFGDKAWRNFTRHAGVISLIHGNDGNPGSSRLVTQANAAALFEVDQILISRAYENTNQEGQSAALSQIFADNVLVYFAPMQPSIEMPSFAYSFRWAANGIVDMTAEVHPFDRKTKSEEVEVGYYQDERITSAPLGFLLNAVTSSQ